MHDEHVCWAGFVRHGSLYENWEWIVDKNGEIRIGIILSFFMFEIGIRGVSRLFNIFFDRVFSVFTTFSFYIYDRFRYIDRLNLLAVAPLVYPVIFAVPACAYNCYESGINTVELIFFSFRFFYRFIVQRPLQNLRF